MDSLDPAKRPYTSPSAGLLPPDHGWVLPRYDSGSIANLPATVAALFGADLPDALQPLPPEIWAQWLPGLRRVVLVVLDGLGSRLLEGMQAAGEGQVFSRLAEKGTSATITSIFPSTTAAALFSLATGCPPAQHGWLAYEIYLRELGIAANSILLCPAWTRQPDLLLKWGLDLDSLVTLPRLAERLASAGVTTGAVLSAYLRNSGFTKMLYRGVGEIRGHRNASDLWVHVRHMLAETRGKRAFLTAYWGGLDSIGHAYGQDTDHWAAEFRTVSHLMEREFISTLPAADREGTLLLITADHGMVRIPPDRIVTANEDSHLQAHLQVPIMGESRAAFVYPRPGRSQAIRDYLEEAFPGWFLVVDSRQALETGLMGKPVSDEAYSRAGELLVLPRDDHALQRAKPSISLVGRHGGLTPDEMLVPLIATRLDALD